MSLLLTIVCVQGQPENETYAEEMRCWVAYLINTHGLIYVDILRKGVVQTMDGSNTLAV